MTASQWNEGDRVQIIGRPQSTATVCEDDGGRSVRITWDVRAGYDPNNGRSQYVRRDQIETEWQ